VAPDSLIARLIALRLCTAKDVQRVRSAVRRMTRDLPAFDSVWIDALAKSGVLTPFQARRLDCAPPESLVAGDFILLDGLEAGDGSHTFLAVAADRTRKVVLKRLTLPADQLPAAEDRLQKLLERWQSLPQGHLASPSEWFRHEESLFVISRYVPGLNLAELLIRRGRFPPEVVLRIADHALTALAACHAAGLAHGDVRLSKLRLTDRGTIVLVDGGLKPAISPELLIHAIRTPEEADVVAPERIGTNQPATAASDLYALGCLLWQLLAGRPPYPQADPLMKLAAHQTRRIADVRELAPETPAPIADLILRLTSPNPLDRPASAETAWQRLGLRRGLLGRSPLARFRRQFDGTVPHLATRPAATGSRSLAMTAALLVLGGAVVIMADRGLRNELLEIAQRPWSASKNSTESDTLISDTPNAKSRLLAIPEPDARGVIQLTDGGPYEARRVTANGPLTICAAEGVRPRIAIRDQPLRIAAPEIALKDIDIELAEDSPGVVVESFAALRTQRLHVEGCRFRGAIDRDETFENRNEKVPQSSTPAAMTWEPNDPRDPQAGLLQVESTAVLGCLCGLRCTVTPRRIEWRNVLKTHGGSAVAIDDARRGRGVSLSLENVTLRHSGPLLSCAGPLVELPSAAGIDIEASDCVFDIAQPSTLVELRGPKIRDDWPTAIRLLGDGSLLPVNGALLAHVDPDSEAAAALTSDELAFEGLYLDAFQFAGPLSDDPRDAVVTKTGAPRRKQDVRPGADVDEIPR
jgi:serine/threonine protein kinase